MLWRTATVALAVAASGFCAALVHAEISHSSLPQPELRLDTPLYLADAPAPDRRPLMALLNEAGIAEPLEKLKIDIFGHIEGSYTYNFDRPDSGINPIRVFDFEHDEPLLNQLNLTVERAVDASQRKWDIGGRMEWIYGADAGLIHSFGLFDWYDGPRKPENQWDLNQLYLDLAIPVGNGLLVRGGKWVTLLGYETINPATNPFYSRSILFGFAIPFTHTGILLSYPLNDNWLIEGAIVRGWDQWEDVNDGVSFIGKVGWSSSDKKHGVIAQFITGPEQPDNESNYRTVFDFIFTTAVTDKLSFAVNADIGFEDDALGSRDAQWYGIAGYVSYVLNEMFTLNGRAEWFRDDDGARTGVDADYYELTAGVSIRPFHGHKIGKHFVIRPELRGDFSNEDVFDDGSSSSQFTAAVDAIFEF